MKINVIATGSAGNLYEVVDKDGNSLIIEAGKSRATYMDHREGKNGLPPEMCIISHGHSDHAHYRNEYASHMPTYFMPDRVKSKNWQVLGYPVKHGEMNSIAFIIKSMVENKVIFFMTDAEYGDYPELIAKLKELNVLVFLIECNYNDFLYHKAKDHERVGCDRHMSDNDVVRFMWNVGAKSPIIITIHGSNRLSADIYTMKVISSKIIDAKVSVAVGAKGQVNNVFII